MYEKISVLHIDRGNKFKNNVIKGVIDTFNLVKGCSYESVPSWDMYHTQLTKIVTIKILRISVDNPLY